MVNCCAINCHNSGKKANGVTFHRFPTDPERREAWLRNVRRKNFVPTINSVVCSDHFTSEAFDESNAAKFCQRKGLRKDAIPTNFDYSQDKGRFRIKVLDERIKPVPSSIPILCFCGYDANSQYDLSQHAKAKRCEIYRCGHCDYITHDRTLLQFHGKTKKFKCEKCNFTSAELNTVRAHQQLHGNKRPPPCTCYIQQQISNTPAAQINEAMQKGLKLVRLTPVKEDEAVKQKEAGVRIIKLSELGNLANLQPAPIAPLKCTCLASLAPKTTTPKYLGKVEKPKKTKEKGFKCDICAFSSTSRSNFDDHMKKIHEGQVHKCDLCEHRAPTKLEMMEHMSKEHEGRVFKCDHCEYRTGYKHNLNVHLRSYHNDLRHKYFGCSLCDFWSVNASEVESHQNTNHTEEVKKKEAKIIRPEDANESRKNSEKREPGMSLLLKEANKDSHEKETRDGNDDTSKSKEGSEQKNKAKKDALESEEAAETRLDDENAEEGEDNSKDKSDEKKPEAKESGDLDGPNVGDLESMEVEES